MAKGAKGTKGSSDNLSSPPSPAATSSVTPRLRFPEFRESADWRDERLADVCERITQGGTPDTSNPDYWNGDVNWLTPAEMGKTESPFISSTARKITEIGLKNCSSELLSAGSVIISTRAPIGHLSINSVPMAINQGCKGLVPGPDLSHAFLFSSLIQAMPRLVDLGAGNTFKELSGSALKSFSIPIPSRAEQQKIADCLTALYEVIVAQGRKVEALKTHKRGLMQQLFPHAGETRPRLRFPEFRNAPEWKERRLGDFITERRERASADIPLYSLTIESGVTPKTERYERAFLVSDEADAYKVVKPDDFAFNPMNLRFGAIGRHSGSQPVALSKYYNIFCCDDSADSRFCDIYFRGDVMVALYDRIATGSLIEKRRVHFERFLKLDIAFPPRAEQQRIADCLSSLDTRITAESTKFAALKTHKRGLMQRLFPAPERD